MKKPAAGLHGPPLSILLFAIAAGCLAAVAAACGSSSTQADINLNGHAVVWAGPASADGLLKEQFDQTVECLQRNRLPTRRGYPQVVVIDGVFLCNGVAAEGCTELYGLSIYIDSTYMHSEVFSHEVIHWETGMSDAFHNTEQFKLCLGA